MTHKPIHIHNLALILPHKICFENFSTQIYFGNRIAIIGRNGSGKSSLLKILQGQFESSDGKVGIPNDVKFGNVPQIIEAFEALSGGQKFNAALTEAISSFPNVLLLDEPTNHLDSSNRKSLMRMLNSFDGTLIVVTHDTQLLKTMDIIWHIDNGKITMFHGTYEGYLRESLIRRNHLEDELSQIQRQKKEIHTSLMEEQSRASRSALKGQKSIDNRKWPTIVSKAKMGRAQETSGNKKAQLSHKKQELNNKLSDMYIPEILKPKFHLKSAYIPNKDLIVISNGNISYENNIILKDINISVNSNERIAICGDNGSGKSTLLKAILNKPNIIKKGEWLLPKLEDIGYLDQHYGNLNSNVTVFDSVSDVVPNWIQADIRKHLNEFLFRKNEEINNLVCNLSGGERARLSLAKIAANPPKLLVLDEITNNLDLETTDHVIQILKEYQGAMIIVSHDEEFLEKLGIDNYYDILKGNIQLR
ncbi:MAG: ABC-F family ATP-binding cassette domain-containing protein [Sphingobacteriia bacterium]|nr:ABC-F family ATP-binding cassette domain-containing protein [Sphingobacteriia bacterium]